MVAIFSFSLNASAAEGDLLTVKAKTKSYGGRYKVANCVMMWIQKPDKTFIKTIFQGAYRRSQYCKTWDEISGNAGLTPSAKDFDGLSGATRKNHDDTLTVTWDCTGKDDKPVENGTYEFWVEMTEDHDTSMVNHGTITIGGPSQTVKAQEAEFVPFLEATYTSETPVKQMVSTSCRDNIKLIPGSNSLSINLPSSSLYSISLLSPAGREIATENGSGRQAMIPMGKMQLKSGVYLVRISQSGKTFTLPYLNGF